MRIQVPVLPCIGGCTFPRSIILLLTWLCHITIDVTTQPHLHCCYLCSLLQVAKSVRTICTCPASWSCQLAVLTGIYMHKYRHTPTTEQCYTLALSCERWGRRGLCGLCIVAWGWCLAAFPCALLRSVALCCLFACSAALCCNVGSFCSHQISVC
jgi:hypothetical protein